MCEGERKKERKKERERENDEENEYECVKRNSVNQDKEEKIKDTIIEYYIEETIIIKFNIEHHIV